MDKSYRSGTDRTARLAERLAERRASRGAERRAYIALGSNMGDRAAMLRQALRLLDEDDGIQVVHVSRVYETDPVGYTDQPAFLNMAAQLQSTLEPLELLRRMLAIELRLGRVREVRWGPRTIDLDLLEMEGISITSEELTLPHPRMLERAFVLVPLLDVLHASGIGHPLQLRIEQIAQEAVQQGKDGIVLWNTLTWHSASAPSGS